MALPVVQYLFGNPVLDPEDPFFDAFDDGVFQPATATTLTLLTSYDMKIVFKGSFTVDGMGVVTGGVVESFSVFSGPTEVLTGSGYGLSAVDLIDAVRAHLYACTMLPARVRQRAQLLREAAQHLVKRSHELSDRADVLMRHAEEAIQSLRTAMRESQRRGAS